MCLTVKNKLKETLLHSIEEKSNHTLWTHHRRQKQPGVHAAQWSKTDVDQAEQVQKRLKGKYNHMLVEPICFYFVIL